MMTVKKMGNIIAMGALEGRLTCLADKSMPRGL